MKKGKNTGELIVAGGSSGSFDAFSKILSGLNGDFQIPVILVLHQQRNSVNMLPSIFAHHTHLKVKEPVDKEKIKNGFMYVAPPDYHLLLESDQTISYSYSEPVNFSRPSIDLLFETAAESFGEKVIGLLLSGSNKDGAKGLAAIQKKGGMAIVQDPSTTKFKEMPQSAIDFGCTINIADLPAISVILNNLNKDYINKFANRNG